MWLSNDLAEIPQGEKNLKSKWETARDDTTADGKFFFLQRAR